MKNYILTDQTDFFRLVIIATETEFNKTYYTFHFSHRLYDFYLNMYLEQSIRFEYAIGSLLYEYFFIHPNIRTILDKLGKDLPIKNLDEIERYIQEKINEMN